MQINERSKRWAGTLALCCTLVLQACGGGGGSAPAASKTPSYTIGGAVSGLSGSVVLQNNSGDDLTVSTSGNFTFATPIKNGDNYAVTVLTQPVGQTCSVSTGVGTVSGGNVSNVVVVCSANAYTVGGTITGLKGALVLQNNSADNFITATNDGAGGITITAASQTPANGPFTFATPVAYGSPYSVTVQTQPANMSCSVVNGTGTMANANVSNVAITCATNTYTVGGTVTGLHGSMVLQDNEADNTTVSVNGPFNFPTAVAFGNPYSVSIFSTPASQHCAVTSGSGTIAGNVSNVGVACANNQMGGAMQLGAALNLTPTVSTFAGVVGSFVDGTGAAARFNMPYASVSDGTNLYVADTGNNAIRKIVIATGAVTTLAGSPPGWPGAADGAGTAATFNYPTGITTDGTNLYVVDQSNNKIRKIVIATGVVSSFTGTADTPMATGAADGAASAATFNFPVAITTDGTSLYVADTSNNKIRQIVIATGVVSSLNGAANTVGVAGAADGAGATATFSGPYGIATDNTNLYVADWGNNKIRQVVIATGAVSSLTGTANTAGVLGAADSAGTAATFSSPSGIATDGTNVYVTDFGNNKIRQIVIATGAVSSLTGVPNTMMGTGKVNGSPAAASFTNPYGISYDAAHNSLFVADSTNNDLRQITLGGISAVTTLAGIMGPDGTGGDATFATPYGTATDGTNLYVADKDNHTIRKIVIATGAVTTLAGQSGVSGAIDSTGTAATFNSPTGITTDGTNVYVTDFGNNKIRQIVIATGVVSSLTGAANTAMTMGAADGPGTAAKFVGPSGITTDGTNLYVTDLGNSKIRQIVIATGVVSSLTGVANTAMAVGAADGAGAAAKFRTPAGITTDGTNLYVVEQRNHKIRQIVIATGVVTSLTGTANTAMATGAADGAGTAATFHYPTDITTDGRSLYVTDTSNNTIRQIR